MQEYKHFQMILFLMYLNTMYKQIGNAVPVLLGKKIGEEIFNTLKKYEQQESNSTRDRKIREKVS